MTDRPLSRRGLLRAAAVVGGAASVLGSATGKASAEPDQHGDASSGTRKVPPPKTPALTPEEVAAVEKALGKKGTLNEPQALYTVALPRNDLKVAIKGEPVPIPFGFGGWVSFKRTVDGKSVMVMSDAVLLQDEVTPVMDAALANGLEVAAVHNHFFYEEPRI
ncbi:MAG TPA: DUF1259 domain-containing protein, partial [Armatimonadaceae bacterium]|nr:DUF1259 domain-containing protein [Armatimonadaceae bacterium]